MWKVGGIEMELAIGSINFWGAAAQMSEKLNFFTLWPPARKRREILGWAIKGEKPGIHRGTNTFWAKSFDRVLVGRSRVRATKCDPLAKV